MSELIDIWSSPAPFRSEPIDNHYTPVPGDLGLTSIVILTRNQLDYTRLCVDSIFQRTDEPYELIFVDNGSTDGTMDYLKALALDQHGIKVIANATNRGFPAAVNQGLRHSAADHILLLNNDVIATEGWLSQMLAVLHSDPLIGLVGPVSNNVSGEQRTDTTYTDRTSLDKFAAEWCKPNALVSREIDRLVGFCLLVRRSLVANIGYLDERFGLGCFEDDDYTLRAGLAGYRAVIAWGSFVHHFGSPTYKAGTTPFTALLEHNRKIYDAKWQGRLRALSHRHLLGVPSPPDHFEFTGLAVKARLPRDWDGDAWTGSGEAWNHPDGGGYFLRAWNKTTGIFATARGARCDETFKKLLELVDTTDKDHAAEEAALATLRQ